MGIASWCYRNIDYNSYDIILSGEKEKGQRKLETKTYEQKAVKDLYDNSRAF